MRIWDQCSTDAALNVTLRAVFAVAHIVTPRRFGPCMRDERAVREPLASHTMAMLNALHDTPACSPADDGSTDSQSTTLSLSLSLSLCLSVCLSLCLSLSRSNAEATGGTSGGRRRPRRCCAAARAQKREKDAVFCIGSDHRYNIRSVFFHIHCQPVIGYLVQKKRS